ncbi:XrtA/PEP-CTERM system histidine kinase PrsK [Azoarcus olearius]|uniref:histidine kinase n=1 Tax=Azoarcus sp. (strain BH72) TaxID=418699 RepID=A1KAF3_AZOSB|nr:XrtA/PEP-CTERM system histidine kinase PrsK [Azoarcus olearius]CAL95809.1 putative two component sensor histidine kinase [Azoarcus olearius]
MDVASWGYGAASLAYCLFGLYFFVAWQGGRAGGALLFVIGVSFGWAIACLAAARVPHPGLQLLAALMDVARGGGWFVFLVVLLQPLGGGRIIWPRVAATSVVIAQTASLLMLAFGSDEGSATRAVIAASLANAVLGLVLVEQLYRGIPAVSRWALKPLCLALGASYIFELYLFADGFLFGRLDQDLWSVRGVAHALVLPLVALSATRNPAWTLRMAVSREMAFHSTALAVSGMYLLVIAAAGYYVRYFGGDWGRALQLTLFFAGLLLLGVLLFSGAQRARLRVFLSKHLFSYRYDYRIEWLRFTQALATVEGQLDLGQSVIRALGDLVESPGGSLWLRDSEDRFVMRSHFNHAQCDAAEPAGSTLCQFLDEREWVINLEEYRSSPTLYRGLQLPEWLSVLPDAWLIIPLKSANHLVGFVVLASPRARFDIDWEVLDLLKTAQRQAASYLARMLTAEALLEARKFESFNRMSAFVVHDLKNLVAQLSLMIKNAERHGHKPEFQADMLETVKHVEGRMRGLMTQLQEKRSIDPAKSVNVPSLLASVARLGQVAGCEVTIADDTSGTSTVQAHPERLERVLGHLVQNAVDAMPDGGKVAIQIHRPRPGKVAVSIVDNGCGMPADFIRDRLSKPFQSTKKSGMGIGVYEARQYLREIGGSLSYDSEVGRGTRAEIELPETVRGSVSGGAEVEFDDV